MTFASDRTPDPRQLFDDVRSHYQRSTAPAPPVEPGSALDGDGAATSPLHLSHAAWFAWTVAVDQPDGVRALLAPFGRFSYVKVIREAADVTTFEPNVLELLWMMGSGFAHGRSRATFSVLD